MADVDESVYLNAARAADEVGPKPFANYIERLAARPDFRAAVESVWEARGEHNAAAIRRVRALAEGWRRRADFALFGALLTEALDAQRPAEGTEQGPGVVFDADAEGVLLARQRDDVLDRCAAREAAGCTYIRMADIYEAYLHDPADAPAALDGGQPDTPAPPAEPATDIYGRPCTIYVPPEGCTDPYRCRVHRGAYPAPAPARSLLDRLPPHVFDAGTDRPVGGEGRTDG